MEEYKILWVDDQHNDKDMIDFLVEAEGEGLILEGYASFEEAFDVLSKDISRFDVILLDGMFFEKKDQVAGTEDEAGIGMAIAKINELKGQKYFPWFVLSGKDQFTKGKNSILSANKAHCFDKTNPKDVTALFSEIKKAAKQQADAQIRHKYQRVFEVCTDKYIGEETAGTVLEMLKYVEFPENNINSEDKLNTVRKVIEKLFTAFNKLEVLPIEVLKGKGGITNSKKFLSGRHPSYKYHKHILHPLIAFNLENILDVTQDGSHAEGDLNLKVDDFIKTQVTPYLFNSIIFQMLDVLVWFKGFSDSNPDPTKNKLYTELLDNKAYLYEGILEQDARNNYFCGDYLLGFQAAKYHKLGDTIRIIEEIENTTTTKDLYKKFGKRFIKL
jgi:hypothetical protein